jgi:hypothetical protein
MNFSDQTEHLPGTKEEALRRLALLKYFRKHAVTSMARSLAQSRYNDLFAKAQRKYKIDLHDAAIAYQQYLKNNQ